MEKRACSPSSILGFWALVILIFVHFEDFGCMGCLKKERVALLQLKAAFTLHDLSVDASSSNFLPSWDAKMSDCCVWDGVMCNETTGRVTYLSIDDKSDLIPRELSLNASLFLPFDELQVLGMSNKYIRGWSEEEGFKILSELKNLEDLFLSGNQFTNVKYLGALSSLKTLSLYGNKLEGPFPIQELITLTKLESLNLGANSLTGSISPSIGSLVSIKELCLNSNKLNGSLPLQGLCKLKMLEELDLSENGLEGNLPTCLGNLTFLRTLHLSQNQFSGNIPSRLFRNLTSLEGLDLSNNRFHGPFSFSSFANNSNLKLLSLSNNDQLEVETENPPWHPTFQLQELYLSSCTINKLSGLTPRFLCDQYDLAEVDLSHDSLKGNFPTCLLQNKTSLGVLRLTNNSFSGPLNLSPNFNNTNFLFFDVSKNHIQGTLPSIIGALFPNLLFLNMSRNALQGSIPSSLGDMIQLTSLDLSNNNFTGDLPKNLFMGSIPLTFLKLSNNNLHGQLFPKTPNFTQLIAVSLNGNKFTGEVSDELSNCSKLVTLNIADNFISGELPGWIGNFQHLALLDMSRNSLQGRIPLSFCNLNELQFLDFSQNNLHGIIPSCFNSSSLKYVHLKENAFVGPIPNALHQNSSLLTLDLRDNNLSGKIPNLINTLSSLRVLLLKGNQFQGPIPIQLCQLRKMSILDLSHNNLSGSIPTCFNNLSLGRWELNDDAFTNVGYVPLSVEAMRQILLAFSVHYSWYTDSSYGAIIRQEEIEFVTKRRSESYKGGILHYMSGLDLSYNKLTGHIPQELGDLNGIRSLNLSYNLLTGPISERFSNLTLLESLDLSYNRLSGIIPPQLTGLTFLGTFSVAYNNLSGRTPYINQFATFGESSYEGNSLCGPPLPKECSTSATKPTNTKLDHNNGFLDSFFISFAIAYIIGLFGSVALLYFNPRWHKVFLAPWAGFKMKIGSEIPTSHDHSPGSLTNETTACLNNLFSSSNLAQDVNIGELLGLALRTNGESSLSPAYSIPDSLIAIQRNSYPGEELIEDVGSSKDLRNLCDLTLVDDQVPESDWTGPLFPVQGSDQQDKATATRPMPQAKVNQEKKTVTIKATYRENIIRFRLMATSGMVELQEEVAKRFKLEVGTFDIKYMDSDQELVLLACDADLQECMDVSRLLGRRMVRLQVHDIVANLGSSCESSAE